MKAGGSHERAQLDKLQTEIGFDDPVNVQFTSGTTGKPKAATLTHFACNNSCIATSGRMGFLNEVNIYYSTGQLQNFINWISRTSLIYADLYHYTISNDINSAIITIQVT